MLGLALVAAAACSLQSDWSKFKVRYGKSYNQDEEDTRKAIFNDNLRYISLLNKIDESASYGVTRFADLTSEEFAQKHLGYTVGDYGDSCSIPNAQQLASTPASYDWTTQSGIVNEVQDQGSCGSCWAFATTAATESANAIAGKGLMKLSEQQLVDCDKSNAGCNGGNMYPAETYIQKNGLASEEAYPYAGVDQKCKQFTPIATLTNHCMVRDRTATTAQIENYMRYYLATYGPVVIGINADKAQFYTGGIMTEANCNPRGVNHAVLAVGYNTADQTPYWKIRNSWGPAWGEAGYFRMVYGKNACGIATDATYVMA